MHSAHCYAAKGIAAKPASTPTYPKKKRPRGFPRGPKGQLKLTLVLGNQWRYWSLGCPEPEADARPHIDRADARRGVVSDNLIRYPDLHIDRTEIVADSSAERDGLIPAAQTARESQARDGGTGGA